MCLLPWYWSLIKILLNLLVDSLSVTVSVSGVDVSFPANFDAVSPFTQWTSQTMFFAINSVADIGQQKKNRSRYPTTIYLVRLGESSSEYLRFSVTVLGENERILFISVLYFRA